MPKVVDHDERRRHIAAAVFRLVARQGLDGVGLREVAGEAGVSMGAVQHYFSSKDQMLLFALDHMTERVLARLHHSTRHGPKTARARLTAGLNVMLPLDEPSREEAAVNIAFFAAALGKPQYQDLLRAGYRRLQQSTVDLLVEAQQAGELAPGVDPVRDGPALFFLGQGLIGPVLIGAISRTRALAILRSRLDQLFV